MFKVTQYSFEKHATTKNEWNLLDLRTRRITTLTDDDNVSEIVWLGRGTEVLYINGTSSSTPGGVDVYVADIKNFGSG